MAEIIDIVVVGAGPCGLGVGVAARLGNVSCVLFDKANVVSAISRYPTHMTFFSTAEKLELGGVPFIAQSDKPNRREALRYYQRLVRTFDLDVRQYEQVTGIEKNGNFIVHTQRKDGTAREYHARNVVIATGYLDTPVLMNIPGEELPHVRHYYKEGHPYFDQDCVVIGAGNSAVDVALDLYRWGARPTLVHFADVLDPGVKPWILPDITNRINNGEIGVRWRSRVVEIKPDCVILRSEDTGESTEVHADFVFAMTGFRPDPKLLLSLGAHVDAETGIPSHDPATMQTNVSGVFIAGVIAAGLNANKIFIENGREHGPKIVAAVTARRA
ncbi:MAG TPA: YpdA family putative bacillithiol disulfide reductase [Longimicrobiales bacterium]|nr:YpdA family putative bacillithiol disulfide reductase [Longimicrobiales bacterium]